MSKSGKKASDDDEVEQLLRAAQDDMLLKLSVNSHMARASASAAIDPDLDRRFEALKKPQKPTKPAGSVKRPPKEADTGGSKAAGASAEGDDLFARFAALKNTIPTHRSNFPRDGSVAARVTKEEEEEEDEVEKLIKWATDAARLDPSPPSDDDDHNQSDDDDRSQDSDVDDDDGFGRGRKSKRK